MRCRRWTKPLLVALGLASSGCKNDLGPVVGEAEAAGSTELQLTRKLDPYLQCLEEHARGVRDSRHHYLAGLEDPKKGPDCHNRRYRIYRLGPVRDCLQELKKAEKLSPSLPPLEAAGSHYAASLQQLAGLLDRAHHYYEGGDFQRDACKSAHALHRELLAAWTTLDDRENELRQMIDQQDAKLLEHELERTLQLYGKGLRFFHKRIQVEAKRVLRVVSRHGEDPSAVLETLSTAVAEFEATVAAMKVVAQKVPDETKAALFWDSYIAQIKEFSTAVEQFAQRRMNGRAYTEDEQKRLTSGVAHWVVGSVAKVKKEYEELARISSSLEFRH